MALESAGVMEELNRLNLYHNEVEQDIAAKIARGQYEEALSGIVRGIVSFNTIPYVHGHTLFLAGFDQLLTKLGAELHDDPQGQAEWAPGTAHLLVLSEFHKSGGHSLVAADIVHAVGGAVMVLTDVFGTYHASKEMMDNANARMPKVMVHQLRPGAMVAKVRELQTIFRAIRPASVMFMTHHPDPLAYVAAASLPDTVRKVFLHHCDHNPALGGTLAGYKHIDFTHHIRHICERHLGIEALVLPLFVEDRGLKSFSRPTPDAFNVVSAGASIKYHFNGELAYQTVIADILAAGKGRFWHIGTLPELALNLIRQSLRDRGIAESRFSYIPNVPSLWDTLKEIDAHVYLNSFPVAAVRGSIEVQACGYPLVFYAQDDRPPLLRHTELFADQDLGWKNVPELLAKLKLACANHQERVARAREFYLQGYGEAVFMRAVDAMLHG